MSDIDLDAIEARAKAAPSGPWVSDYSHDRRGYVVYRDGSVVVADGCTSREAAFIAHARTDIPALIARVREQEQEIARLRLDEHRLNWLDVHPRIVVADRGEHGFQWAVRDVEGACIWLGGLRQAIDRGREIEAIVAAEADR